MTALEERLEEHCIIKGGGETGKIPDREGVCARMSWTSVGAV